MQRLREPVAAITAAIVVFVGIVAPAVMLVMAVTLAVTGLAVLIMSANPSQRTPDRRRVQNPR